MTDDLAPRVSGDIAPVGADLAPVGSDLAPASGNLAPVAADIAPIQVDLAPVSAADASLLALVDRLAVLLERSDLTELAVEAGGTAITLRKTVALASPAPAPASSLAEPPPAALPPEAGTRAGLTGAASAAAPSARSAVLAPLTGIFYASPSPGSSPYVQVGGEVVVGQVIGLIEAMKLFNEIKSDKAGRVVRVVPEDGTLVKAKHPLIEVEPL
jgi:acetyl-CoA carboxylase biotin carboxyl carrier protein